MKSNEDSKKNFLDKASSWYEEQSMLRAIIQFDFLGCGLSGSLDTLLALRGTRLHKQRVDELFRNVSERLSTVEESKLNKDFPESEEFFDLLRSCAETVVRSSSQQKRKYVADFLAGTIEQGRIHDLSEQIVEDLKLIQDFHLQILAALPENLVPNPVNLKGKLTNDKVIDLYKLRENVGMDWGMFNKGISDLERFGFIYYTSEGTALDAGDMKVCRPAEYLTIFKNAIK